jgi:hypothetical protein
MEPQPVQCSDRRIHSRAASTFRLTITPFKYIPPRPPPPQSPPPWRDDKTFKYELVSSGGGEKKDWRGGEAGEAHDPCSGFVQRARRGSEAAFELFQGCEEEPER